MCITRKPDRVGGWVGTCKSKKISIVEEMEEEADTSLEDGSKHSGATIRVA